MPSARSAQAWLCPEKVEKTTDQPKTDLEFAYEAFRMNSGAPS
jgi:hypothetical protein